MTFYEVDSEKKFGNVRITNEIHFNCVIVTEKQIEVNNYTKISAIDALPRNLRALSLTL